MLLESEDQRIHAAEDHSLLRFSQFLLPVVIQISASEELSSELHSKLMFDKVFFFGAHMFE